MSSVWEDFISLHVVDSAWEGVVTVTLDVPPGAHFNILVPIRMLLGALRSEVVFPCLSVCHFQTFKLFVVTYSRAGKLLIKFLLFSRPPWSRPQKPFPPPRPQAASSDGSTLPESP